MGPAGKRRLRRRRRCGRRHTHERRTGDGACTARLRSVPRVREDVTIRPVSAPLASMLSTCRTCRLWAEQDEGPYHRDTQPLRRDVVEDREGLRLQLGIRLAGTENTPLRATTVEIWQCD